MNSWPFFSPACRKEVDAILRGGRLTAYRANAKVGVGPVKDSQAWRLEREIEKKFGVRHAVATNSGTAALHAALSALDLRGREVITSPFTFSATASAITMAGGVPRFVDVGPASFCITKETVSHAITKKTAAILPVHLFGYFQDLGPLQSLGLPIIEDACQAVGASRGVDGGGSVHRRQAYSGTVGLAGAYSFNGSKNLPAGEGGCLVTNSDKIAEKARLLVNHGENFGGATIGHNYRMHEIVACLARHGLRELEERNQRRVDLAWEVQQQICARRDINPPFFAPREHVYYVYPFTVAKSRPRFISRCSKRGLTVGAGYINPILSEYPAFRRFKTAPLPVAEELSKRTLCILSTLTPEKPLSYARKVAGIIREALG